MQGHGVFRQPERKGKESLKKKRKEGKGGIVEVLQAEVRRGGVHPDGSREERKGTGHANGMCKREEEGNTRPEEKPREKSSVP